MENLGIDIKLIIAQIVNFVIFFIIYKKFIAKPFINFIDKEKKNDEEKERILNLLKTREEVINQEEKEFREKMRKEVEVILKKANDDAQKIKEEILSQAKREADDTREKGEKQIKEEKEAMLKEIKNKIADLSISIVNSALKEYLDDSSKKQLTEYIVSSLSKEEIKYEG